MTSAADDLKPKLLQGILTALTGQHSLAPNFSGIDWIDVDRLATQHRLRPLLHGLTAKADPRWPIPDDIASQWRESYLRSGRRYLRHLAAMAEIAACLDKAGLPYAFLKGSALITGLYPDPAYRPVRDLDILLAPKDADQAAQLLQASLGYAHPLPRADLIPEDYTRHKHLQPLYCARRKVTVELHRRLADKPATALPAIASAIGHDDILLHPAPLLAATRPVKVGTIAVRMLDWPATLLHLIAHAVHDHQLNVGPLILCDVEMILGRTDVDLTRFWSLAEASGRAPAAELILAVMDWCGSPTAMIALQHGHRSALPANVVEAAATLLLQDTQRGLALGSWARILASSTVSAAIPLALARWRHLRRTAAQTGVGRGDARLSLWQRARAMAGALWNPADRREIQRSKAVADWLSKNRTS